MNLDDYIYTVKHAKFDKDKFVIPESITILKKCKTFNEAKEYLENECKQYPLNELYIQCEFRDGNFTLRGVKNE